MIEKDYYYRRNAQCLEETEQDRSGREREQDGGQDTAMGIMPLDS